MNHRQVKLAKKKSNYNRTIIGNCLFMEIPIKKGLGKQISLSKPLFLVKFALVITLS